MLTPSQWQFPQDPGHRVVLKLEEGDFKGAVQIASSVESFASDNAKHWQPPGANTQLPSKLQLPPKPTADHAANKFAGVQ